jgi:TRAP-type mannitol/chloroaromatic compound transport system substrate-binding protein
MSRRKIGRIGFLAVVVCTGAALALATSVSAKTIVWQLQSSWTAGDFHQLNAKGFANKVNEMAGGRFKIKVMAAGAIVPAFELLDAVHKGILDAANVWPGYWTGKHPAATLFGSIPGGPFGMNSEDFLGWLYFGGGIELYNELLQKELKMDVVAFPCYGETPEPQGWFPKPIKSLEDFKGLKFRAAGMSAEVFKEMGMSVVTIPGGEIVPALERGVIDAAEYGDPSSDMSLGFHDVRKYYHLPGMHQPTGMMEILINKKRWDELPDDLKAMVRYACMAEAMEFVIQMLDQNSKDAQKLITEHGVTIVQTPREILIEVLKGWDKVAAKHVAENPFFAKVYASQKKWAERIVPYRRVAHPDYDIAADYYWGEINPYKVMKP